MLPLPQAASHSQGHRKLTRSPTEPNVGGTSPAGHLEDSVSALATSVDPEGFPKGGFHVVSLFGIL